MVPLSSYSCMALLRVLNCLNMHSNFLQNLRVFSSLNVVKDHGGLHNGTRD